jgi:hypothetical protein
MAGTAEQLLAELTAEMARLRNLEDQQRNADQLAEQREREQAALEAGQAIGMLVTEYNLTELQQRERRRQLFAALAPRPGMFVRFSDDVLWCSVPSEPYGQQLFLKDRVDTMTRTITEARARDLVVDCAPAGATPAT